MSYQRSLLRHRTTPLSLRPGGFPTHQPFLSKPQWSMTWIAVSVFLVVLLGVVLAAHG
jgi:hypothetical protein